MQDSDYSEAQRTEVQGRWTICPRPRNPRGKWDFAFRAGVTTHEPGMPVVPCDGQAVERGARALAAIDDQAWGGTGGYEDDPGGYRDAAAAVLRAAGETCK